MKLTTEKGSQRKPSYNLHRGGLPCNILNCPKRAPPKGDLSVTNTCALPEDLECCSSNMSLK